MYAYRCPGKSRSLPTIPTYVYEIVLWNTQILRNVNLDQYHFSPKTMPQSFVTNIFAKESISSFDFAY